MEIKEINEIYFDECVSIAIKQYNDEAEKVPALYKNSYKEEIEKVMKRLCSLGNGVVALEKDKVVGYLCFGQSWNTYKTGIKGIASPLIGYGAIGEDRKKVISLLFQHGSENLRNNGVGHYEITLYAHDIEAITSCVFNNFGMLCTDAMRNVESSIDTKINNEYTYEEITYDEVEQLVPLYEKLVKHLESSPTYYWGEDFTNDGYLDYLKEDNVRIFVAKDKGKIITMMDVSTDGNHFMNRDENTVFVGNIYLDEAYRGKNIPDSLLAYINEVLRKENIKRIGVEYGTVNPTAQRFWSRYFHSYTYTVTRSIDERFVTKLV